MAEQGAEDLLTRRLANIERHREAQAQRLPAQGEARDLRARQDRLDDHRRLLASRGLDGKMETSR